MTDSHPNNALILSQHLEIASNAAAEAYQNAIHIIESQHGEGYAKKNPHSVNHVMSFQQEALRALSNK